MNEDDRYIANSGTGKKIIEHLGFEFVGCNPDWKMKGSEKKNFTVKDEFMGRLALVFGERWVGNVDVEEKKRLLESRKSKIATLKSMLEEDGDTNDPEWEKFVDGQKKQIATLEKSANDLENEIASLERLSGASS